MGSGSVRFPASRGDRREALCLDANRLLLVALDDPGWSDLGALGVLAGVAAGAALPKEIPALVQRHTQRLQPLSIGVACLASSLALPELVLLGDHPVNRVVNLRVVQRMSPRLGGRDNLPLDGL
jgi:hypothetical protein